MSADFEILHQVDSPPNPNWDHLIAQCEGGNYFQSSQQVLKERLLHGFRSHYLLVQEKKSKRPLGFLLLQEGFLGRDRLFGPFRFLSRPFRILSSFMGPLFLQEDRQGLITRALLNRVDQLVSSLGVFRFEKWVPDYFSLEPNPALDEELKSLAFDVEEYATVLLRFSGKTSEELFKGLHSEARRKVRRAKEQELHFREANSHEDLNHFLRLSRENRLRNGLSLLHETENKHLWRERNPDCQKIFLVFRGEMPLAAQMLFLMGKTAVLAGVSQSDLAYQEKIPATDLLQWEIIDWCREQGLSHLDWGGYTPEPRTEKQKSINQFKIKWGGDIVRYMQYSKTYSQWKEKLLAGIRKNKAG